LNEIGADHDSAGRYIRVASHAKVDAMPCPGAVCILRREPMTAPAAPPPRIHTDDRDSGRLRLSGQWTLEYAVEVGKCLEQVPDSVTTIDAGEIDRLDSLGVLELKRFAQRRQLTIEDFSFREDHCALVAAIHDVSDDRPRGKREFGVYAALARLGFAVTDNWKEALALVAF